MSAAKPSPSSSGKPVEIYELKHPQPSGPLDPAIVYDLELVDPAQDATSLTDDDDDEHEDRRHAICGECCEPFESRTHRSQCLGMPLGAGLGAGLTIPAPLMASEAPVVSEGQS